MPSKHSNPLSTTKTTSSMPPRLPHIPAIPSGGRQSNAGPSSSSSFLGPAGLDISSSSSSSTSTSAATPRSMLVPGGGSSSSSSSNGFRTPSSGVANGGHRASSGGMMGGGGGGGKTPTPTGVRSEDSKLNFAIVKERWGNQRKFMEAHGLRVGDPGDHETAERILDGYRAMEKWDFGGKIGH